MTITNDLIQPNGDAYTLVRVRTAYTARPGDLVAVNTAVGAAAITLPATVTAGEAVAVGDDAGDATNAITVSAAAGIDGELDYVMQTANAVEQFLFDGSTWRRVVCGRTVFDPIRKIVVPRVDLATMLSIPWASLDGSNNLTIGNYADVPNVDVRAETSVGLAVNNGLQAYELTSSSHRMLGAPVELADVSVPAANPSSGAYLFSADGVPKALAQSGMTARLDGLGGGFSMVQRCTSGTLPDTGAGSTTVGSVFRMLAAKTIIGVRFFWPFFTATPAYTVKVSVWNNSSGVQLATTDVSVQTPGPYEAIFTGSPITTDLTGVDIVIGLWEKSGTRYPRFAADASFEASMPIRLNSLVRVVTTKKFLAGDNRPTSDALTERYGLMEPIIAA